jgi:hypothetical protein
VKRPVRPRKLLIPENSSSEGGDFFFSDELWVAIRKSIPTDLPRDLEEQFKNSVSRCCNAYFARDRTVKRGLATAAAIRRGGGKQASPLDQLLKHLRDAAKALTDVEEMQMFDDRPGLLNNYRAIVDKMAEDIEGRKNALRKATAVTINPRHELVRSLASACALVASTTKKATGQLGFRNL